MGEKSMVCITENEKYAVFLSREVKNQSNHHVSLIAGVRVLTNQGPKYDRSGMLSYSLSEKS